MKTVELSRDQAEGLCGLVAFALEQDQKLQGNHEIHRPDDRDVHFASQGALVIAEAFGMSEKYKEQLRP